MVTRSPGDLNAQKSFEKHWLKCQEPLFTHIKRELKLGTSRGSLTDQWGNQVSGSSHLSTSLASLCYLSPSMGFKITASASGNISFHSNIRELIGEAWLYYFL